MQQSRCGKVQRHRQQKCRRPIVAVWKMDGTFALDLRRKMARSVTVKSRDLVHPLVTRAILWWSGSLYCGPHHIQYRTQPAPSWHVAIFLTWWLVWGYPRYRRIMIKSMQALFLGSLILSASLQVGKISSLHTSIIFKHCPPWVLESLVWENYRVARSIAAIPCQTKSTDIVCCRWLANLWVLGKHWKLDISCRKLCIWMYGHQ